MAWELSLYVLAQFSNAFHNCGASSGILKYEFSGDRERQFDDFRDFVHDKLSPEPKEAVAVRSCLRYVRYGTEFQPEPDKRVAAHQPELIVERRLAHLPPETSSSAPVT